MTELNTIYNEDCLETMKRMPDNFIDLTVTSPPYDNLRTYNGYSFDFESIAKELYRVTKDGGVVVWVVGDATVKGSETGTSFKQALYFKECGFNLHDTMIYQKAGTGASGSNYAYWQSFEYMFVLSKGRPSIVCRLKDSPNKKAGSLASTGKKTQVVGTRRYAKPRTVEQYGIRANIWRYHPSNGNDRTDHPAPFPELLAKDHIISWSNAGGIVYDPFMGSGTTAKMARDTGRNYIGSEISKEYCDIAEERLKQVSLI